MSPKHLSVVLALTLVCVPAIASAGQASTASTSCDRRCLLQFLFDYTEALTDNNISRLTLAPSVRATNNGIVTVLGKGDVWGSARRLPYRQVFVDPVTGAAVFYGVVTTSTRPTRPDTPASTEAARWWYYVARLKVDARRITEVEEIAYEREPNAFGADPAALTLADRIFDTVLPEGERSTREQLFDIANKYFDAVSQRIDYRTVPWHPECQRIELGVFTVNAPRTSGSCGGEFQVPSVKWNVENRRFYIADVERGVVLAVGNFMTPPEYPKNNGSVVTEVFKVQDGMIRHIHAFFRGNGQLHSGWGSGPGS
jgi:hypothetical protein